MSYDDELRELNARLQEARNRAEAVADAAYRTEDNVEVVCLQETIAELQRQAEARGITLATGSRDSMPSGDFAAGDLDTAMRGAQLTASDLAKLQDHVVDLNQGLFSDDGEFKTKPEDVDRIFEGILRERLQKQGSLRLLFYAHGGLVSEQAGLAIALKQIDWWLKYDVYPIFFVWETDFWNTVEHLLLGIQQRTLALGGRDIADYTTDPVLESLARAVGGPAIWGGMKRSAEIASSPGGGGRPRGGAYYVAEKLKALHDIAPGKVEIHAAGHSAGSIFHAHFITAALGLGIPAFESLHLMAPAITVETFEDMLLPRINANQIRHFTMYSMKQALEKDDDCARVYRKSLLYFIYYALESTRKTDLLGLEECVWRHPSLKTLFGLDGTAKPNGESVWSRTQAHTGRTATRAVTHAGFDDDCATMGSVLRRVAGKSDTDPVDAKPDCVDGGRTITLQQPSMVTRFMTAATDTGGVPARPVFQPAFNAPATQARRCRALCVGINSYPGQPLYGCVADAQLWVSTLRGLGFDAQLLIESAATYAGIKSALQNLIASSAPGDVIVFQYAGHGTSIPNPAGGEPDEAIVPIDYDTGALLLDKEFAEIFSKTPDGVNLTTFFDSCHSGDINRLLFAPQTASRPRYLKLTPAQVQQHLQFAQRRGLNRLAPRNARADLKDVTFAACRRDEWAFESNGQGDFTLRTTGLLHAGRVDVSNHDFYAQITAAFQGNPRQHPQLLGAPGLFGLQLLAPRVRAGEADAKPNRIPDAAGSPDPSLHRLAEGFRQLADYLDKA